MIELKFPKELILTKPMVLESVLLVITGTFVDINFEFQTDVCNGGHNLMQKAMNFNDIAIVTVRGNDYRIHFLYRSKDETINLSRNADLTEKSER